MKIFKSPEKTTSMQTLTTRKLSNPKTLFKKDLSKISTSQTTITIESIKNIPKIKPKLFINENINHFKLPLNFDNKKNNYELKNFNFNIFNNSKTNNRRILNSIESYSDNSKFKSLENYKQNVNNLMSRYIYSNPNREKLQKDIQQYELTRTKQYFFNKSKEKIQKIIQKSKSTNKFSYNSSKLLKINNSEPEIKLSEFYYKNPIDSLGLILRNKIVHDEILSNYQDREVQFFGSNIKKIKNLKKFQNSNQNPNIKIINIIPHEIKKNLLNDSFSTNMFKNASRIRRKNPEKLIYLTINDFLKGYINLLVTILRPMRIYPESREEFCMNYDLITNSIYLFSGMCCNIKEGYLWKFNMNIFQWELIKPFGNYIPDARMGHTGILYKNKYYIFGGKLLKNNKYCDLDIFHFDKNIWEKVNLNTKEYFHLRKNHIACLIGQEMLIHGGLDENGEILDDCFVLNLNNLKWFNTCLSSLCFSPKLAFHSCCLVASKEILRSQKINLYKLPDFCYSKKYFNRIKEMGIYVYGGKIKNCKEPSNVLWLLKIGKKPVEWVQIDTKGKSPSPRYLCSMNFCEVGNYLIIHGGTTKNSNGTFVLNDTFLLELFRLEWLKVKYGDNENIVKARNSHCGVICHRKLFIFGGLNDSNYNGSNFLLINLDPSKAKDSLEDSSKNNILPLYNSFENSLSGVKNSDKNINNNNSVFKSPMPKIKRLSTIFDPDLFS